MSLQLDLSNWQPGQVLFLVSKPDLVVLEVEVDRNAIGQDILDKVCSTLGTVEKDYFGLQYYGPKREPLWLNMRNKFAGKLSGQSPFRLRLRVKYFVEPHYLLQESTRRIFYLQLKQDFSEGKLNVSPEVLPSVLALAAQAEYGDLVSENPKASTFESYAALCPSDERTQALSSSDLNRIFQEHASIKGCTRSGAIAKLLAEVAKLPTYGTDCYHVRLDTSVSTQNTNVRGSGSPSLTRHQLVGVKLRIGPHGVEVLDDHNDEEIKRVPFKAIKQATHTGKLFEIHLYQDNGSVKTMAFRTTSESCSNALYRIITEMLAFYTWDTVHWAVMDQHSLDFKSHFFALFRPNDSDMSKQYVFDIQRTSREVYDNARRTLYRKQQKMQLITSQTSSCPAVQKKEELTQESVVQEVEMLRERLTAISDALTCRICFDHEIECAFVPCGHQVCCRACASQCQICPICRHSINESLTVFLPVDKDFVMEGESRKKLNSATTTDCSDAILSVSNGLSELDHRLATPNSIESMQMGV